MVVDFLDTPGQPEAASNADVVADDDDADDDDDAPTFPTDKDDDEFVGDTEPNKSFCEPLNSSLTVELNDSSESFMELPAIDDDDDVRL